MSLPLYEFYSQLFYLFIASVCHTAMEQNENPELMLQDMPFVETGDGVEADHHTVTHENDPQIAVQYEQDGKIIQQAIENTELAGHIQESHMLMDQAQQEMIYTDQDGNIITNTEGMILTDEQGNIISNSSGVVLTNEQGMILNQQSMVLPEHQNMDMVVPDEQDQTSGLLTQKEGTPVALGVTSEEANILAESQQVINMHTAEAITQSTVDNMKVDSTNENKSAQNLDDMLIMKNTLLNHNALEETKECAVSNKHFTYLSYRAY